MASILHDVTTDFRHILLSTQFEIKKHIKRKRLFMTGVIAILPPILFYFVPLVTGTDFAPTSDAFALNNIGFITILITISGAIFAGDAISGEQEKQTGLLLYSTHQRRNTISVGKYLAAVIATFSVVSLFYLITAMEIIAIYGVTEISLNFIKSFLLALLYSTSVVSIIYFFSSVMQRSMVSTLLGFFSLMMILPIVSSVLSIAAIDPWFILTHSAGLISNVLGFSGGGVGFGPDNLRVRVSLGVGFTPEFYLGIAVMTAYSIIFFLAGVVISNRKMMER
jgi:ABC-type transport system involved in multi-copper enzyme maturation permease subunit